MLNLNPRLADVHAKLYDAMFAASMYVSPTGDVSAPSVGDDAYAEYNTIMNTIKSLVEQAKTLTYDVRIGHYATDKLSGIEQANPLDPQLFTSKRSYFNLYKRYEGYAPIFGRKYNIERADTKVNNHLANDFFGEICDDKASFCVGTPVWYKNTDENQDVRLQEFLAENAIPELDLDTMTLSTICGVSYRYYWMEEDYLKATLLAPWDVIVLDFKPTPISIILSRSNEQDFAEVFCENVYVKIAMGDGTEADLRYNLIGNPVVAYPNNPQWQGDCYKVLELCDAYDRALSDISNEAEQLRTAYLVIEGGIELDTLEEKAAFSNQLKNAGILQTPTGTSANFISKSMQMDAIVSMLELIENNIYRFSKSINYNNKNAGGSQPTAFALKQRLTALKNKCLRSWMSFNDANKDQWQVLANFLFVRYSEAFDPDLVVAQPKLNIPVDLKEEVAVAQQLMTIVSNETALKQLSIFENEEAVKAELVLMERDGVDPNMLDEPITE